MAKVKPDGHFGGRESNQYVCFLFRVCVWGGGSIQLEIKKNWKIAYHVNKSLWPLSAAANETVQKIMSRLYTGVIDLVEYITKLHHSYYHI